MATLPTATPPAADALEQRDTWRNAWQALTNDALLLVLCLIVVFVLAMGAILPQQPAGGTADPLAYSQWQTQARAITGGLFDAASTLELFNIAQAYWLRIVLAVLVIVVLLRLVERLSHLLMLRRTGDVLFIEGRLRVTDQAPALPTIAPALRTLHYRVTAPAELASGTPGWLTADRLPWAELFSIGLHLGLLVIAAGALVNFMLGWDVARQQIDTNSPVTSLRNNVGIQLQAVDNGAQTAIVQVQGETQPLMLPLGQTVSLSWVRALPVPCCLALRLAEITPGYRVSASDLTSKPLTITMSSYDSPTREALLTFRRDEPDRLVVIDEAHMALLVSDNAGGSVQVYSALSGKVITETQIRPSIVVSNTTLFFKPTTSAVISVQYRPGDELLAIGGILAFLGLIATALWPMQRLVVRHHGHWTEVYAAGRGVRRVVRELLNVTSPSGLEGEEQAKNTRG
jgi:hypothetical protein